MNPARYVAIDTFAGFTDNSVVHETEQRNKDGKVLRQAFSLNRKRWLQAQLSLHELDAVEIIEGDAVEVNYSDLGELAFCLIDVDLYLPVREILPKVWQSLAPGGIIVVDDCKPNSLWDGAEQAYKEFCRERGHPIDIREEKLGILRKAA